MDQKTNYKIKKVSMYGTQYLGAFNEKLDAEQALHELLSNNLDESFFEIVQLDEKEMSSQIKEK